MATLILTAVGTVIGGPIGGALGALVGGTIDRSVLAAPGTREGPRLTQLAVQTSSYGTQIAKLFGTTRVAGTVIWSTDLLEQRSTSRAGKGQPTVSTYSYAASFAVLLSARPVLRVGRIWADGNLLRGAGGDWKASTGFRLHTGDEDQPADPLIASAVGAGRAPAHRGCAYAVFENLQLAGFGNRIPSLTFEVVADEGAVPVGAIAAALAPEVAGEAALPLLGFAATGGSAGAVVEMLATAGDAWLVPAGGRLTMRDRTDPDAEVAVDGAAPAKARATRAVSPIETVPRTLSMSYYDPARDYQAGVQQARRPGPGEREQRLDLPAVIEAGAAKTIAAAVLSRAEAGRTTRTVVPGLAGLAIAPGACVRIAGEAGRWRVVDSQVEGYGVTLTLVPLAAAALPARATSGAIAAAPDLVAGRTLVEVFELPSLDDRLLATPRLLVAATGTGAGWRRAALLLSLDNGASWAAAGATALPATMGTLVSPLAAAPSTLVDLAGGAIVELARPNMLLEDASDARLDAGANLALVGDEVVQFGRAEPLGGARWRLTRLWRGRRGTEGASGRQRPGDRFVLLEADALASLDLPLAAIGTGVRVLATGIGDVDGPVEAGATIDGCSVVPPSPVHLVLDPATRTLEWTRRSRVGWRWTNGIDTPLAEEAERYRVTVSGRDGGQVVVETDTPTATLPAAPNDAGIATASVVQRGTSGWSAPAFLTLP